MSDKQMVSRENGEMEQAKPVVWSTPPVDIYETDDELVLTADLPGVADNGLQLEVSRGVLTLEAEVQAADNGKQHGYYRQFKLSERIDADCRRGCPERRSPHPAVAEKRSGETAQNRGQDVALKAVQSQGLRSLAFLWKAPIRYGMSYT